MSLPDIFRANLKAVMAERGLSKRKVFLAAKMSANHFYWLLDGDGGVTLKTVQKICEALNVEPSVMLEEQ